jgi:hypothetical protein
MEEQFATGKMLVAQKFDEHLQDLLAGILKQHRMFGALQNSIDSQD